MRRDRFVWLASLFLMGIVSGFLIWSAGRSVEAQTSSSKAKLKSGTTKTKAADIKEAKELEGRAEKNLEHFLEGTFKLAEDFEKLGQFETAQEQLRLVSRLRPDFPGIKEKIEKLSEALFDSNDLELEHDVKESWKAHVLVSKGKPVRVEAAKEYNLNLIGRCDAKGLPVIDARTDMVAGIRCGALMGLVVPLPDPGKPVTKSDKSTKIGDPFEIGASKEFTPKEDGVLLLNINLPQGHKSTGKLLVRIAGHIKPLPKELR